MARIFITGSSDGLGLMAAKLLQGQGNSVVLHARNNDRAANARASMPIAEDVVVGDLSSQREVRSVADQVNALGAFDAVIHNAAVGYQEPAPIKTADGLPHVFAVNTLAPYMLTTLIAKPRRLIYLSSGLHKQGDATLRDLTWEQRRWNGTQAYSDTKLQDTMLAFAVARLWPDVYSNAVEPGWVATKMGGPNATDDLQQGHITQAWLAVSDDPAARQTGKLFYHQQVREAVPAASNPELQEQLLSACQQYSGLVFPRLGS